MGKLSGKNAIVTGTARGFGMECASWLTSLGADIGAIDIDLKSSGEYTAEKGLLTADTVMDEVKVPGVNSVRAVVDIGSREQVFAVVEAVARELRGISILVGNAGGGVDPMDGNRASQPNWKQLHAVVERNFFGTVYTRDTVTPITERLGYGKIANVASVGGLMANSSGSYPRYASSKAAVIHYTKLPTQELGPYSIVCNVITPGFISTARLVAGYQAVGEEKFTRNIALGRSGTPEECANAVGFLAADLSSYVSGAVLGVTDDIVGRILINQ